MNSSTKSCINCLSNNVTLLDMSSKFIQNGVETNFIDVYKRCTEVKVVPFQSQICELCCQQYKSIFKFLCKTKESQQALPEDSATIETAIKIEDDNFEEEFLHELEEIHLECVKVEPIEPSVTETTSTSVTVKVRKVRSPTKRLYYCEHCPLTFPSPKTIKKHFLSVHKLGTYIVTDDVNGRKTKERYKYTEKKHFCPYCPSSFMSPSALNTHILPVHKGIKIHRGEHLCSECGKILCSLEGLEKHAKSNLFMN
jgi:hypothetical protein